MIANNKMTIYSSIAEFIKEHSLCPVERPVIDTLSNIKNIPKMNDSINTPSAKFWIKRITIKPLEIVVEGLGTFTHPEVGVCDDRNFTPCQTSANMLHPHYSHILPQIQARLVLAPDLVVSVDCQAPVDS